MKKFLLPVFLAILVSLTLVSCGDNDQQGLAFSLNFDGTYSVSVGEAKELSKIVIPTQYRGKPVTDIGSFNDCVKLEEILIPEGIATISNSAFKGCVSLTDVTLPKSLRIVGDYTFDSCTSLKNVNFLCHDTLLSRFMFKDCSSLESVTIPDGVGSIQSSTFEDCTGLKNVTIPDSVTSISDCAFKGCTALESITVSESVKDIGHSVFKDCTSLGSVSLPNGLRDIPAYTFENCSSLKSIVIPDGVVCIDDYAFYRCTALESIYMGKKVSLINDFAFDKCVGLNGVYISDLSNWCHMKYESPAALNPLYYAKDLYLNGELVTEVVITEDIGYVSDYAFSGCKSIKSVSIYDFTGAIPAGKNSFWQCDIKEATVPSGCIDLVSVETLEKIVLIGDYISSISCRPLDSLKTLVISDSVISIESECFDNYPNIEKIEVDPDNETYSSIDGDLYNKSGTTLYRYAPGKLDESFDISDTVTIVSYGAFQNAVNLRKVNIGSSVAAVVPDAFVGCRNLKEISVDGNNSSYCSIDGNLYEILVRDDKRLVRYAPAKTEETFIVPGNVRYIEKWALDSCDNIKEIIISSEMSDVTFEAVSRCINLKYNEYGNALYLGNENNPYSHFVKLKDENATLCDIHSETTAISSSAFEDCKNIESIKLPDSVKAIHNFAFIGCEGLRSLVIPDSVVAVGQGIISGCYIVTVYCEAKNPPVNGWNGWWNTGNCPVVWGYTE